MPPKTDWPAAIKPLMRKYKGRRMPLNYHNTYELLVMVILAAQSADEHINTLAPAFFQAFPDLSSLAKATPQSLFPYISKVRNFGHKADWLTGIAKQLRTDANIPQTLDALTALPGIGRKSANVILREEGRPPEGIIVDLHVVRVAPRLGIATGEEPKKIEKQLMDILPRQQWDAGMAMSFLGREICHPKPDCPKCLMRPVCAWYRKNVAPKEKKKETKR